MALTPGTRLGIYEITAQIGEGGMGAVYRATDTSLSRQVAIKVLPDAFAQDAERLARFEREAKTLAALNHPHIAAIYGLETGQVGREGQEGPVGPFLVMELVEGEDLSEQIAAARRQSPSAHGLPLDEALAIARQVAEALEAAHEQGIIHRDLKPANIKVRADGTAKVLDFGLAKAIDSGAGGSGRAGRDDLSASPTLTSPALMTGAGVILGTAAYMAPEQAKGRPVDKRADLWAFGVVLFEMLAGVRPFDGDDMADVLGAVVRLEPDWTRLPVDTPPSVRALLEGCLTKDLRNRVSDISTALFVLKAQSRPSGLSSSLSMTLPAAAATRRSPGWLGPMAIALAAVVGAAGAWLVLRSAPVSRPISRVSFMLGDVRLQSSLSSRPGRTMITITPDGRTVIFRGLQGTTVKLFSRALDQGAPAPIAGTEGGAVPFLSPDGQWLGFWADGKLKKVPVAGGAPITICDAPMPGIPDGVYGASWGAHGTIAFSDGSVILTVPASGGTPTPLTTRDASKRERAHLLPSWLPDEQAILYTVSSSTDLTTGAAIVVQTIASGERRSLIDGGADGRYVSTGHLVYMQLGALMAAPFDLARLEVRGNAVGLVDGVMQAVNADNQTRESGAGQYALAANGTLTYVAGGIRPDAQDSLVWVDRRGVESAIDEPPGSIQFPRISPDGQRIAFARGRHAMRAADIWVYDVKRGASVRLTSDAHNTAPVWSPDGQRVAFRRSESTSVSLRAQAVESGSSEEIPASGLNNGNATVFTLQPLPGAWSRERDALLLVDNAGSLSEVPLGGDHVLTRIPLPFNLEHPALSPDGHWLAYRSTETGRSEVYVRSYPALGQLYRVSSDNGSQPAWGAGGRELFYTRPTPADPGQTDMEAVDVSTAGGLSIGKPRVLFSGRYFATVPTRAYDVAPDGQRFLMTKRGDSGDVPQTAIQVVLNWAEDLKSRAPAGK